MVFASIILPLTGKNKHIGAINMASSDRIPRSVTSGPSRSAVSRTVSSSGDPSRSTMNNYAAQQSSKILRYFEPCAATASMFLYAQGNSVVCCHHDTLTIERRFSMHKDEIQILEVDNMSESGGGRLVVSYDVGQTTIVWDLMTGDEVARFASFDHLTCAAWMKNGTVAFGESAYSLWMVEARLEGRRANSIRFCA